MEIILAFIAGVLVGGFAIGVNMRAPERVKTWLANWFPNDLLKK